MKIGVYAVLFYHAFIAFGSARFTGVSSVKNEQMMRSCVVFFGDDGAKVLFYRFGRLAVA